jgi:ABC-2 type transport system permease protein
VNRPGAIAWLARHELRLAWRDWLSLMTGGHRRRTRSVVLGFTIFALLAHGLAYQMLASATNLAGRADKHDLVVITGTLVLTWPLMLSQAMESVTRAYYARGDLELILTSPVAAWRLFAVRIAAMAATIVGMTLVLAAPFIDMLAWLGGAHWLGAYAVTVALGMDAVAVAIVITVALFRVIGPRRTRLISQIVAAVVGAAFVIGVQFAAILSFHTMSRTAVLQSATLDRRMPNSSSVIWWPARAVLGEPIALATLLGLSAAALAAATYVHAPSFGRLAIAASGVTQGTMRRSSRQLRFHDSAPEQVLRRKEWTLLLRDPWLMSQTLMQLLYLLPAVFLLWHNFYDRGNAMALLVPVLIMAAGQFGGGLAWLAVSGEDAPELIASAPVSAARVLRAKTEAVLGGVAAVFGPFVVLLAAIAPFNALTTLAGVGIAAGSATVIQFWFRTQARRSLFRRRQTSSRFATFAEALSSIGWAGTGALAAAGTWLAVVPGLIVVAIITGTWMISPARSSSARSSLSVSMPRMF